MELRWLFDSLFAGQFTLWKNSGAAELFASSILPHWFEIPNIKLANLGRLWESFC